MKTVWTAKIDNIIKCGHSLNEIGVNNWALNKNEALSALNKFAEIQVPILGGDVCELMDDIIQYNYDNWHCEQIQGEANPEYILRSIKEARRYIEAYNANDFDKIFFAFVPRV
jgi:hypothetical protein